MKCVVGYIVDENGKYLNSYREDSLVCDENYIAPTVKASYGLKTSFWVIVHDRQSDSVGWDRRDELKRKHPMVSAEQDL